MYSTYLDLPDLPPLEIRDSLLQDYMSPHFFQGESVPSHCQFNFQYDGGGGGGCSLELVHCLWVQSGLEPTNTGVSLLTPDRCLVSVSPNLRAEVLKATILNFNSNVLFVPFQDDHQSFDGQRPLLLKNHPKCVAHLLRDPHLVLGSYSREWLCPDRRGIIPSGLKLLAEPASGRVGWGIETGTASRLGAISHSNKHDHYSRWLSCPWYLPPVWRVHIADLTHT